MHACDLNSKQMHYLFAIEIANIFIETVTMEREKKEFHSLNCHWIPLAQVHWTKFVALVGIIEKHKFL